MKIILKRKVLISGIVIAVLFPILVNCLVATSAFPHCKIAGDTNAWISFWGAYAGALGTIIMAYLTIQTLNYTKSLNRPYIYPSIEVVVQKQFDSGATENQYKWYNEISYCICLKNYGNEPATGITMRIDCSNRKLLENEVIESQIKKLQSLLLSLGSKEEKRFYLCPAEITPEIRRKEKSNQTDSPDFDSFISDFKKSDLIVEITYNESEFRKPQSITLPVASATYALTTTTQMLDSINRSLQNLTEQVEHLTNNNRTSFN